MTTFHAELSIWHKNCPTFTANRWINRCFLFIHIYRIHHMIYTVPYNTAHGTANTCHSAKTNTKICKFSDCLVSCDCFCHVKTALFSITVTFLCTPLILILFFVRPSQPESNRSADEVLLRLYPHTDENAVL